MIVGVHKEFFQGWSISCKTYKVLSGGLSLRDSDAKQKALQFLYM